ncbi:hypothetical protein RND81_10G181900 [Saponaria officinalis]|uniref:Uncharacterized protein n=1 Tax=Saponaria officinalis TaxID=3572 RepID=A0AAW1I697_SAPOF
MNNLDVEKTGLIDISLEDDFLIDKQFDNSSVDLRLSVAFETQMELISDLNPRARVGINGGIQCLADKEIQQTYGDGARKSLAWDNAFFTSPGFLELEELCLVNRGFQDPQRQSICGDLQSIRRRKVCMDVTSGPKSRVATGCRQSTRSLARSKLASSTNTTTIQDLQRHLMTTRRSEAFSGATSKSPVTQGITKRKEYLKSSKATGQNRFSIAHNKKAPLQGVSRNVENRTSEMASSLPFLPSTAINTSVELSPYRSEDNAVQTVNVTKSQETNGECFTGSHSPFSVDSRNTGVEEPSPQGTQCRAFTNASYTSSSGSHQSKQRLRQPYVKQVNSGRELQRQSATKGTKSPLSAAEINSHNEEKENMIPCDDNVTELKPKKGSPLLLRLGKFSESSRKRSVAAPRTTTQTNASPMSTRKTFSSKISPLQRSSIF